MAMLKRSKAENGGHNALRASAKKRARMRNVTVEEVKHLTGDKINRMTAKELRNVIQTAGHSLNKRLQRIEKNDLTVFSPAYKREARETGGKARFTSKGKNISELRHVVAEMKHFSNMRTGTVKGARVEKEREISILNKRGDEPPITAINQYWENFHRARELHPELSSGQVYDIYSRVIDDGDLSDVMDRLNQAGKEYFEGIADAARYAEAEAEYFGDPFDLFS